MPPTPHATRNLVRDNLRTLMKVTGQTQADVAAGMRLDQTCVSDRLRGRARITLDDLDLIAAHFGITVANLVSVDYERRYYGAPGEY